MANLISEFHFYFSHSCRYDSTHVGLHRDKNISVTGAEDGKFCINGAEIMVFSEKDPKLIPWSSAGTPCIPLTLNIPNKHLNEIPS